MKIWQRVVATLLLVSLTEASHDQISTGPARRLGPVFVRAASQLPALKKRMDPHSINVYASSTQDELPTGVNPPGELSPTERRLMPWVVGNAFQQLNFQANNPTAGNALFVEAAADADMDTTDCPGTSASPPPMEFQHVRSRLVFHVDIQTVSGNPFSDLAMDGGSSAIIQPWNQNFAQLIEDRLVHGVFAGQLRMNREGNNNDESILTWYVGLPDNPCDPAGIPMAEPPQRNQLPLLDDEFCQNRCGHLDFMSTGFKGA